MLQRRQIFLLGEPGLHLHSEPETQKLTILHQNQPRCFYCCERPGNIQLPCAHSGIQLLFLLGFYTASIAVPRLLSHCSYRIQVCSPAFEIFLGFPWYCSSILPSSTVLLGDSGHQHGYSMLGAIFVYGHLVCSFGLVLMLDFTYCKCFPSYDVSQNFCSGRLPLCSRHWS